eukprot:TRINITY_DN16561_c0_g1_i1.p1 TRINITY_DN16561_c0_g1~~TRINITY_DN16561_c0_g1_i1.p1  ORF type:complete len:135 (+),score=14.59 TRINITY_DN16561_c0_g1_i1:117-521(+)
MDALNLLLNRSSHPRLQAPAPAGEALTNIMQAALRAPDHACLAPWRFIVCEKSGLAKLGDIFEQAAIDADMTEKEIERAPQLPKRAPMVIVAIAKYVEHPKCLGLSRLLLPRVLCTPCKWQRSRKGSMVSRTLR